MRSSSSDHCAMLIGLHESFKLQDILLLSRPEPALPCRGQRTPFICHRNDQFIRSSEIAPTLPENQMTACGAAATVALAMPPAFSTTWLNDSGQVNIFSSMLGVCAAQIGTECLLLALRHMLALGLKLLGRPCPFVCSSSIFAILITSL
jgi:hypothetical protein